MPSVTGVCNPRTCRRSRRRARCAASPSARVAGGLRLAGRRQSPTGRHHFISSMICFSSAGISGIGASSSCIWPSGPLRATIVQLAEPRILVRIVVAEVPAPALLASEGGEGDGFGNRQQVVQVEGRVPARVVFAVARHLHAGSPLAKRRPGPPGRAAFPLPGARCPPGPASSPGDPPGSGTAPRCRLAVRTGPGPTAPLLPPGRHRSGSRRVPWRTCAANSPARLPKTSKSDSELPPSRLAPLMPTAHSPQANSPGTRDICVSGSTRTPPMM